MMEPSEAKYCASAGSNASGSDAMTLKTPMMSSSRRNGIEIIERVE